MSPDAMTPELVERMLENQSQELALRAAELQLQQQKDQNAFAFGKEALAAQATDREQQRTHIAHVRKCTYIFAGIVILLIVCLLLYALSHGKDAYASELTKAIFFLLSGGAGGYGLAKSQHKSASQTSSKKAGG